MSLPCIVQVLCMTWYREVNFFRIIVQDLYDFCLLDQWARRILSVSCLNNCSWIISTVLESPFYSSSCCQTWFPSFVRPIKYLWELILEKILDPTELNCSVIFSLYCLRVSKKVDHFLRDLVFGERTFPWFNLDPIPSFNGNDSWWRTSKFSSLWFCFCLRSACNIFCTQF